MLEYIKNLFKGKSENGFESFYDLISKDIVLAFEENDPSYKVKMKNVDRIVYITSPIAKLTYIAVVYVTSDKGVMIESDIVNKKHSLLNDKNLPKLKESYDGIALVAIHDYLYNNEKGNK